MLRSVQPEGRCLSLLVALVICWLTVPTAVHAGAQSGTLSPEEQQLRLRESRNQFIRSVDRIPTGRGDRARQQDFREDLRTFRNELVALWALRFAPMTEEWAREELEDGSDDLGDTLERMRKFVDRGSDPPDFEPVVLEGATLAERLDRVVAVGLRLRESVIDLTEGDVLSIELLNAVRSDFATLESWAEEFHELAKQ